MPEIDWDAGEQVAGEYAGMLSRGLSWVARAAPDDEQPRDGSTEFIASTGSVDRMGDSIDQQTWRLAAFRANPVILYEHHDPVIGRGKVGLRKSDEGKHDQLRVRIVWDAHEANPIGLLVAHQHANGFRRGVSVGFIPGSATSRKDLPEGDPLRVAGDVERWRAGYLYRHAELLEVSSVGVPANRDTLQLSAYAREGATEDEQIRRYVRGGLAGPIADFVLDAIRHDKQIRRAIQAAYLGTPEPARPSSTTYGPRWVDTRG